MFKTDCWTKEEITRNGTYVECFLTSSFIYYHRPDLPSICSDETFDWCCKMLIEKWDTIIHHHKALIDYTSLTTNSNFDLPADKYPRIVKRVAVAMAGIDPFSI